MPEVTGKEGASTEKDITKSTDPLIAGHRIIKLTDVTQPSLTLYQAKNQSTTQTESPAVLVFPGGGYALLAYDLEGTEVCTWLNSIGVSCVLVKYRVPAIASSAQSNRYPENVADLADAQRAMRLTREHAAEWRIDPKRIGVLGFSAGAHLAVVLSNHADQPTYPSMDTADSLDSRPDFALVIYPGYLAVGPDLAQLDPVLKPSSNTPPTFLLQAEDDPVHVENAVVYFQALKQAKVSAELHIYAAGGHGYGLRQTDLPVTHWTDFAATWLRTMQVADSR